MKKINKKNLITCIIILLFILILAPMIYISKYNYPSSDDYTYGIETHKKWNETHSLIEVIKTSIERTKNTFTEWQGSFTAIFLMTLQPSIFGEQYYWLTTILLVGIFALSNMYLMKVILCDYLKCSRNIFLLVALSLITISMQFVPNAGESFYWYNGSIYYTFFYSIALILLGKVLKILKEEDSSKINTIIACILAFFIGTSNYCTALVCNIILALVEFIMIIKKDKKAINIGIILAICLTALMISVKAPGNSVRQAATSNKMSEINSIIYSLKFGKIFLEKWTTSINIIFYISLIPIMLKILKKMKYQFKMPILVTIITYGIFSAQLTPVLYAQNASFPPRLLCIVYYSMYWLVIINIFYWLGYINNKIEITEDKNSYRYCYIIILLIGIICVTYNYKSSNSYIAIKSIQTGEAIRYKEQMEERIKKYKDKNIQDVEVEKIREKPYLLFISDLTENPEDWLNGLVRDFYSKNSVKIISRRFIKIIKR